MAVTWPPSLPRMPLQEGYQRQQPASLWTFEPDEGAPYVRPKGIKGKKFPMTFFFTLEQLRIFEEWYEKSTFYGVLPFDYEDPDFGTAVQVMFDPTADPHYASDLAGPFYRRVTMTWQVLP
ncbi:hypothetical protein AB9L11_00830 [Desulfovibrio piger]